MNTTSRESVSKTDERIDKLSTLVEIVSKKVVTPAPVKAVEEICVTCSGPHAWYNCPNTDNNQASVCAATGSYNQVNPQNRVSNQMAPPGFAPVQNNGQNRFNQNQGQGNNFNWGNNFHGEVKNEIQNTMKTQQAVLMNQQNVFQSNLQNMISGFFQNQASTSVTPSSNNIPNPKCEMKAITTRSGVAYEGPSIPTNPSPKKVVEQETEERTDKEQSNFQGSTAQILPLVTPISIPEPDVLKTLPKTTPIPEPDVPKNLPKPNIPYPSRLNKISHKSTAQIHLRLSPVYYDIRKNEIACSDSDASQKASKSWGTYKFHIPLELYLRDDNEQIIFHVDGTSKHPQKHVNESIKMVNDTSKDCFEGFADGPTLVCLPPPEDDEEKEKQEVKNLAEPTAKRQTRITPCLKNFKDSLIMGDDHLSTFSVEEIIPIPRESEDTSRSDSKNVLPSYDDLSSINVPRDDFMTFSNSFFEFDVNFNSSDINPLFDEVLVDIECKDSL
ncbi:hypothetical protein Tco_0183654 [Tanacetum coccineum]